MIVGGFQKKTSVDHGIMNDKEEYQRVMSDLALKDSGDIFIEEILNEEYDDWYDNDEEDGKGKGDHDT